jgi:hypothetical protein
VEGAEVTDAILGRSNLINRGDPFISPADGFVMDWIPGYSDFINASVALSEDNVYVAWFLVTFMLQ